MIPLIIPKVPQSSLGILRVPQLPPPLEHPRLRILEYKVGMTWNLKHLPPLSSTPGGADAGRGQPS